MIFSARRLCTIAAGILLAAKCSRTKPESSEEAEAEYRQSIQERQVRLAAQRILNRRLHTTLTGSEDTPMRPWTGIVVDLNGAELTGADLSRTHLRDADFTGAILEGALLTASNLDHAAMAGATLRRANLDSAGVMRASFTEADLTGAILVRASLRDCRFAGADLTGADLTDADLTGADLTGADLTGATLANTSLGDVTLSNESRWPSPAVKRAAVEAARKTPDGYRTPPHWRPTAA